MIKEGMKQLQGKSIMFYDGTCGFCQASVQLVLRYNKKQNLYFAPLQSGLLADLLPTFTTPEPLLDSIIFYEQGRVYTQSEAVLRIARHLRAPFSLFYYFRIIPRVLRDNLYDLVARNRYRIAGRNESCLLPTPEQRARFIQA